MRAKAGQCDFPSALWPLPPTADKGPGRCTRAAGAFSVGGGGLGAPRICVSVHFWGASARGWH